MFAFFVTILVSVQKWHFQNQQLNSELQQSDPAAEATVPPPLLCRDGEGPLSADDAELILEVFLGWQTHPHACQWQDVVQLVTGRTHWSCV